MQTVVRIAACVLSIHFSCQILFEQTSTVANLQQFLDTVEEKVVTFISVVIQGCPPRFLLNADSMAINC